MDFGLAITGLAAITAAVWGRGQWLKHVLFAAWAVTVAISVAGANMAATVFTLTTLDLIIAAAALIIVTHNPDRTDAKIIGGISMLMMPMHLWMSAASGRADWTMYATVLNGGFIVQCLIVRGWLDGVGRTANRFVNRLLDLPRHHNGHS